MHKGKERLYRFWRKIRLSLLFLIVLLIAPLCFIGFFCGPFSAVDPLPPTPREPAVMAAWATVPEHLRAEDQTYLTFPEWYIVFSADEYAAHVATQPPSSFPFFASVWQYWRGYAGVCAVTKGSYPFNGGYHLMLYVIGTSFTVENGIKGIYEGTLGRLTEWISSAELTPEDALARQYAKEYGDFIHAIPWFDFPYMEKLHLLWTTTGWWGPNPVRKWERKLALSTEFLIKAAYGALIGWGTEVTYGAVDMEIYAVATNVTDETLAELPEVKLVERMDDQYALITIPHYEPFTVLVPELAERGVHFVEFAGNDQVMLTAFAPRTWEHNLPGVDLMFAMEVLVDPTRQRIGLNIPVARLHEVLAEMAQQDITIEHIYDY
ncbi:MAG: hypothetical protein KF832_28490 [Caldilineaceae bacterium]|nr:hypothetical protein [Caldilineaceae bacterium]